MSRERALALGAVATAAAIVVVLIVTRPGTPAVVASPTPTATASATATARASAAVPSPTRSSTATASRSPIPMPTSVELSAPTTDVVWALVAGQALFRSDDRGDTWQERPLPSGPAPNIQIGFVSDREGWAIMPGSPATQCQAQGVAIAHTVDGGATWASLTPSGLGEAGCKSASFFADAQHGFIAANTTNAAPLIYRTSDGGQTWIPSRPLPEPPASGAGSAGFTLRVDVIRTLGGTVLAAASGQSASGGALYVYRSTDGGASWTYAATTSLPSSLAFVTPSRWLDIGSPVGPRETTDAGATWHAFATDYRQAAPIGPSVLFADATVGYATVRGTISRTTDGGAHWTGLHTPGT